MEMSRADFYEKELSFQVSCSYGPGRYDSEYEEKGNDYPVGFVRWTEQRNFEAILDMMAEGRIDMKPLISHRFKLGQAAEAYDLISSGNPLGVLLQYPAKPRGKNRAHGNRSMRRCLRLGHLKPAWALSGPAVTPQVYLVPAFAATGARLKSIASATGVSSVHVGKKNQIEEATTDTDSVLADEAINTLVITTRHNSHAGWVRKGLEAGKHIFVEKPLTLTRAKSWMTSAAFTQQWIGAPLLMVGFNRRYSPLIQPIAQGAGSKIAAGFDGDDRQRRRDAGRSLDAGYGCWGRSYHW